MRKRLTLLEQSIETQILKIGLYIKGTITFADEVKEPFFISMYVEGEYVCSFKEEKFYGIQSYAEYKITTFMKYEINCIIEHSF